MNLAPSLREATLGVVPSLRAFAMSLCSNVDRAVFAKLKHLLRKEHAGTAEAVGDAVGKLLQAFSSNECVNYLENAGYAQKPYVISL